MTFQLFLGYNFLCHINKIYCFNRQNLSKTALFALHYSHVFAFSHEFARFSHVFRKLVLQFFNTFTENNIFY